jgi:hypothetical protein
LLRQNGMIRYLFVVALMLPVVAPAAQCRAHSGDTTQALVELYTSEGCSSCPPADRWLSTLSSARGVVPIAFHVHYWDYIGWKDPFADPRYTERQKDFAKATGADMVYTPQVLLSGRDFRGWRDAGEARAAVAKINGVPSRASVEIDAQVVRGEALRGSVSAKLLPNVKAEDLALVVAVTQNGLASLPNAGENKGAKLLHSFAARDFVVSRSLSASFDFKARPDWDFSRLSIVAFLQNVKTEQVVQALAAPCG